MPPDPPAAYPRRQRAWPRAHPHGQSDHQPPGIQPSPPAASLVDHAKGLAPHHPGPQQRRCRPAHLPQPKTPSSPTSTRSTSRSASPAAPRSPLGNWHGFTPDRNRIDHWRRAPLPLADGRGALRVSLAPAATRMALRLEPSAGQGRAARPTGGGGAVRGWQKTMTRPGQRSGPRPHHRGEIRPDAWRHTSKPWTSTCCRGATPTP